MRSDCSHGSCRGAIPRRAAKPYCFFHLNKVTRDERGRFLKFAAPSVFAGGTSKLEFLLKGFEVDKDWAEVLRASPEVKDALQRELANGS